MRTTCPTKVETTISPEAIPCSSGSRIIKDLPSSSTVTVKSVPLIPMVALGVSIEMFSLLIEANLPVINLAVPLANCRAILDLDGSGS